MNINKILVPLDLSENSMRALEQAKELARRFEAEILLVHVVEPLVYPSITFGTGAASLPAIREEVRENLSTRLEKLAKELTDDNFNARCVVRDGNAFAEINQVANEENVDLIAISTHGYSGIKHFLLGSTAEKVVRAAPCPVLTVRTPDD